MKKVILATILLNIYLTTDASKPMPPAQQKEETADAEPITTSEPSRLAIAKVNLMLRREDSWIKRKEIIKGAVEKQKIHPDRLKSGLSLTPLAECCMEDETDFADFLLRNGANTKSNFREKDPFPLLGTVKSVEMAELFFRYGGRELSEWVKSNEFSILDLCKENLVTFFVKNKGLNVDIRSASGMTKLMEMMIPHPVIFVFDKDGEFLEKAKQLTQNGASLTVKADMRSQFAGHTVMEILDKEMTRFKEEFDRFDKADSDIKKTLLRKKTFLSEFKKFLTNINQKEYEKRLNADK